MKSAIIHEADIASVAATALTTDGHAGQEYWLTGPQALTPPEKVRTISDVLGREVRYVELTKDEIVMQWRQTGYSAEDIEFFLAMRTNPPEA
ncbi:MAG: hydroxylase, partial [Pseudonocardiaceae bacterium]